VPLVGGYLAGTVLGVADVTGVNVESIVVAVIGAVIVVAGVPAGRGPTHGLTLEVSSSPTALHPDAPMADA